MPIKGKAKKVPPALRSLMSGQDTTTLSPEEEARFRLWVHDSQIPDLDHPDSHFDYRGYWKATGGIPHPPTHLAVAHQPGVPADVGERTHFPDVFKQHGHETFSNESQYATPTDFGGRWGEGTEDTYLPQLSTSRTPVVPGQLGASVRGLIAGHYNTPPGGTR